jgi:integration host factor subunit alpha
VTKADIADKIHTTTGLNKKDSVDMLESVISIMKTTLESGEKIKIASFANFEVKLKKDRIGRNPQTGETITIEAHRVLIFKPSAILKDHLNKSLI